jgi:hypothetical protein
VTFFLTFYFQYLFAEVDRPENSMWLVLKEKEIWLWNTLSLLLLTFWDMTVSYCCSVLMSKEYVSSTYDLKDEGNCYFQNVKSVILKGILHSYYENTNLLAVCFGFVWLTLWLWRWRWYIPLKCRYVSAVPLLASHHSCASETLASCTVINPWVVGKVGNLLASWLTISLSRGSQLQTVTHILSG